MAPQIIAQTAKFVREAGGQAEFVLSVRQAGNPNFGFLGRTHRLHRYFRWLVHDNPQASSVSSAPSAAHCAVAYASSWCAMSRDEPLQAKSVLQ